MKSYCNSTENHLESLKFTEIYLTFPEILLKSNEILLKYLESKWNTLECIGNRLTTTQILALISTEIWLKFNWNPWDSLKIDYQNIREIRLNSTDILNSILHYLEFAWNPIIPSKIRSNLTGIHWNQLKYDRIPLQSIKI